VEGEGTERTLVCSEENVDEHALDGVPDASIYRSIGVDSERYARGQMV
jgi:hypothetical protein